MTRNLFEYHPRIGYRFIPGLRARCVHEDGGYLVAVNGAGFRCRHEFEPRPPDGVFRVLLFGDSYTAGEGVSGPYRYGELLEERIGPRLQVLNFGLPASGTDQQLLAFEEFGAQLDYHLLVISPLVENIERIQTSKRLVQSTMRGGLVLRPKPYFELDGDALSERNVPVPREIEPYVPALHDRRRPALRRAAAGLYARVPALRRAVARARRLAYPIAYNDPASDGWRLMRAILARWIGQSRAPVVLVPLPLFDHVHGGVGAGPYRARFREFAAATGAGFVDVLPHLRAQPRKARQGLRFPVDDHPTKRCHALYADVLEPVIRRAMAAAEQGAR